VRRTNERFFTANPCSARTTLNPDISPHTAFLGNFATPKTSSELALSVEESDLIAEFVRDFSLSRSAEAGLSVIVPHQELDLISNEIVRESIFHFYYPILSSDLVVEVV
jgi:hypothetical protein